jgi:FKBP-type peptidyl-prolyl cis-trans isomerase (trigger factor)
MLHFACNHEQNTSHVMVDVQQPFVQSLYQELLLNHQKGVRTYGFSQGQTPVSYVSMTNRAPILQHIKDFFYFHSVHDYVYESLAQHKMVTIGPAELSHISLENEDQKISYQFNVSIIDPGFKNEWKRLHFKPPCRKNYKDLDKQAELFIQTETKNGLQISNTIAMHDWVCFSIKIYGYQELPILPDYKQTFWLKISNEEPDSEAQKLFIDKKVGDIFINTSPFLQELVSSTFDSDYRFEIEIIDRIPTQAFSLDYFRQHFRLKSNKDIHSKLIEIFSFRNDISQRRETAHSAYNLLIKNFPLALPEDRIKERQRELLHEIHTNPDYLVYKKQSDFNDITYKLATRQLYETILIDYIAYQENIEATHQDIVYYLNFMQRPRMQEFLFFRLPSTKLQDQEMPLTAQQIKQQCLREKTLNHVINHLTKKQS